MVGAAAAAKCAMLEASAGTAVGRLLKETNSGVLLQ
jgi:hypothetical protein